MVVKKMFSLGGPKLKINKYCVKRPFFWSSHIQCESALCLPHSHSVKLQLLFEMEQENTFVFILLCFIY